MRQITIWVYWIIILPRVLQERFLGISTSGNSANVIRAVEYAREHEIHSVGLLGRDGGKLAGLVDTALTINVDSTARVQEAHILVLHIICEAFEPR